MQMLKTYKQQCSLQMVHPSCPKRLTISCRAMKMNNRVGRLGTNDVERREKRAIFEDRAIE